MEQATTKSKLKIGNVELASCAVLAPMAGITDMVLRQLVRQYAPNSLLMSEMVSSEALKYCKINPIIDHVKEELPLTFQLSGHKPDIMAEAAKKLEPISTFVDINMGCPAPKIVKNGDGSKLMTELKPASSIISAVKDAVSIPVTVKCRLGWDHFTKNYLEFAMMAEESGADAIIVHGRTRSQMYSGKADWQAIAEIKQEVGIPVIANGDVVSPESAKECLDVTGCDGVAIGRGILGDPGLVGRVDKYLATGELEAEPDLNTRLEIALTHTKMEAEYRGEEFGVKYMRKFYAHYVRNIRNACKHRFDLVRCNTVAEVEEILVGILHEGN